MTQIIKGSASLEATATWSEIPRLELEEWNGRLQKTSASLYQFPLWNEPFRTLHFNPKYLIYQVDGKAVAYICILTIGLWKIRIGMVRFGPVPLMKDGVLSQTCLKKLEEWARSEGYIFLRFSHSNVQLLNMLKLLKGGRELDAFPLYPEEPEALIVKRRGDDQKTLASFSQTARHEMNRAIKVGYEITQSVERTISI